MTFVISIFILSLLGLGVFFGLRIRAIRKGFVAVPANGEASEHISDALNFNEIKNRLHVFVQIWSRKILLIGLKYSIKTTHYVRAKFDLLFIKINKKFIHHHNKITARENASTFLEEIGKHKEKIRKKTEI